MRARVDLYFCSAKTERKVKDSNIDDDEATDKVLKPSATAAFNHQVVKLNKRAAYLCLSISSESEKESKRESKMSLQNDRR